MENFIFCARLALSASMKPFVQNQCCQQQDWFPKIATTDLVSSRLNSGLRKVFHRGSRSHMFFKIGVLINFAIFTGKHRRWTLFLIKLQFFRPATLSKETPTQVFSCEYCDIFKNSSFIEHLWWLLLVIFHKILTCQCGNNYS